MTAVVLALTVAGVPVFWGFAGLGLDLVDSIYFMVTIITTTGFGDINLREAPPPRLPLLVADIRLTDTLRSLHVERARSVVVVVTSSDIVNLETALNVRTFNPKVRVVLRLFDPDLAARVERAFAIDVSRSPSALAAPSFAAAAAGEQVLTTVAVGRRCWSWSGCGWSRAARPRGARWPSWRTPPPAGVPTSRPGRRPPRAPVTPSSQQTVHHGWAMPRRSAWEEVLLA